MASYDGRCIRTSGRVFLGADRTLVAQQSFARFSRMTACFVFMFLGWGSLRAPVLAQGYPDIFRGPQDVLYAQPELLQSVDEAWFVPLSPASKAHPSIRPMPDSAAFASHEHARKRFQYQSESEGQERAKALVSAGKRPRSANLCCSPASCTRSTSPPRRHARHAKRPLVRALHRIGFGIARLERQRQVHGSLRGPSHRRLGFWLHRDGRTILDSAGTVWRRPRILDQYVTFHGIRCHLAYAMENRSCQ